MVRVVALDEVVAVGRVEQLQVGVLLRRELVDPRVHVARNGDEPGIDGLVGTGEVRTGDRGEQRKSVFGDTTRTHFSNGITVSSAVPPSRREVAENMVPEAKLVEHRGRTEPRRCAARRAAAAADALPRASSRRLAHAVVRLSTGRTRSFV
ncbi:hypothetical protein [Nannocystis pusilla]|uniref:hypothetical protein n=1 Tax=Nannocystis pusilla TaxID=889268 RepID=UPI003B7E5A6C